MASRRSRPASSASYGHTLGGAVGHSGEGSPLQFNWPDISLPQFGDLQLPDLSSFLRLGDWLPTAAGFDQTRLVLHEWVGRLAGA